MAESASQSGTSGILNKVQCQVVTWAGPVMDSDRSLVFNPWTLAMGGVPELKVLLICLAPDLRCARPYTVEYRHRS